LSHDPIPRPRGESKDGAWHGQQRIRLLIDSIRDYAIVMLDPQGRIASWNSGAERLKGFRADEIIGRHFSSLYPPEDAAKAEVAMRRVREDGRYESEGWRVRKDGSRFWANAILSEVRDASGDLVGFAKVTRDLTERRLAEEALRQSEERVRILVDSVKDYAIFMLDRDGRVETWNQGAELTKGYDATEIVGKHFSIYYTPGDVADGLPQRLMARALAEGRVEQEGWRVRKDGSQFWADVVLTALRGPSGELLGFAKVTRDLTERRKLEEERIRLAHAEEAIRLRDEFLSLVSHELKTPLTALQMQLEMLQEKIDPADGKLAVKVQRAARASERLGALVEGLLDVSRLATGRFEINATTFDIGQVVSEVVEGLRGAAASAGCVISIVATGALEGRWDRVRIEQVVTNLVSNAVKYGAGQPVDVVVRRDGDQVVLEVRDHGPGVAEQDLGRIFDRFERASSMRNYGGLGLGLYVVREITVAHGGSVSAGNAPGGGALFSVRLPVSGGERP
jgi:PAS domain S-box-containing protein